MTRIRPRVLVLAGALVCAALGIALWLADAGPMATSHPDRPSRQGKYHPRTLDEPPPPSVLAAGEGDVGRVDESRPAAPDALRVLVLDPEGRPQPGARLVAVAGGRVRFEVRTSEDGTRSVARDAVEGTTLYAVHPDHVAAWVQVLREAPRELVLGLGRGERICGRVSVLGGAPIPTGTRVVGLPSRHAPSTLEGLGAAHEDPRVLVAQVEPSGEFCLVGAAPGSRYRLLAGATGWACTEPRQGVLAGTQDVTLEMGRVFALEVVLLDSDGGLPRTTERLSAPLGVRWPIGAGGGLPLSPEPWIHRMAGVPEHGAGSDLPHLRRLWFTGPAHRAHLGPIAFSVHIPGYAPTQASLLPAPFDGSSVPRQEVRLDPIGGEWGELEVILMGDSPVFDSGPTEEPTAQVRLRAGADTHAAWTLSLHDLGGRDGESFGVPFGEYHWSFEAGPGNAWSYPENGGTGHVVVGPEPARIEIHPPPMGALQVDIAGPDGVSHQGEALIRITREGERRLRHVKFLAPPYVLNGLPVGKWTIAAITGETFLPPGGEYFRAPVEIRPGHLAAVHLRYAEP